MPRSQALRGPMPSHEWPIHSARRLAVVSTCALTIGGCSPAFVICTPLPIARPLSAGGHQSRRRTAYLAPMSRMRRCRNTAPAGPSSGRLHQRTASRQLRTPPQRRSSRSNCGGESLVVLSICVVSRVEGCLHKPDARHQQDRSCNHRPKQFFKCHADHRTRSPSASVGPQSQATRRPDRRMQIAR